MDTISQQAANLSQEWETDPRWSRYQAQLHGRGRDPAARLHHGGAHARPARRQPAVGTPAIRGRRARAGRDHRQPGGAEVKAGLQAIYLSGWQVAADGNLAAQTYPDQSLYPVNSVPADGAADQQRAAARGPDRLVGAFSGQLRAAHQLARADRRGRRGRLRRRAERVRADEGDDRGGRRGRALRGPALVGEEVRPPRREGAHPDRAAHQDADRRAAGGRRGERADAGDRPHRRARRRRC